jgi:HK97 gp10 family phage protein
LAGFNVSVILVKSIMDGLAATISEAADERLYALGKKIAQEASSNAPKLTGALSESIYVTTTKQSTYGGAAGTAEDLRPGHLLDEASASQHEALIGPCQDYGADVEFGTLHQRAQPYLVPAAESVIADAKGFFYDLVS